MQIEVISVSLNTVPTAKGSYQVAEVAYKDLKDGKVNGKKIMSFANKEVFNTISKATQGQKYTISLEKDDKGYWQWQSISTGGNAASAASSSSGNASPRSTYETPEERAKRQDYIIRQSSLSSAIGLLKTEKNVPSTSEVIACAEEFVKFVYAKPEEVSSGSGFNDMSDDVPL